MCGILGLTLPPGSLADSDRLLQLLRTLYVLTESRGKEASGFLGLCGGEPFLYKDQRPSSAMIKSSGFLGTYRSLAACLATGRPWGIIGHSRLVTSGTEQDDRNNQPMTAGDVWLVHNGIVVNEPALWDAGRRDRQRTRCDSEVIAVLVMEGLDKGLSLDQAIEEAMGQLEGETSVALLSRRSGSLALFSNTGSIYYARGRDGKGLVFASEKFILDQLFAKSPLAGELFSAEAGQVKAGAGLLADLAGGELKSWTFSPSTVAPPQAAYPRFHADMELAGEDPPLPPLRRCTVTVLPETMPYLTFDANGVSNYASRFNAERFRPHGEEALLEILDRYRRSDGQPDCLVAFSGGRDSSYGLHLLKTSWGMNPIAYTYDWGMVTDLARRNQARLCGRLGVEHVWVSADIRRKRANIGKNVKAWMRKPELGMIPLFMAGDKAYFYYAMQVMRQQNIRLMVFFANHYETTYFKTAFCGLPPSFSKDRPSQINFSEKVGLLTYYMRNFLTNPAYLNSSLYDTAFAYWSYYMQKTDFVRPFNYVPWREDEINTILCDEYDWEVAEDTTTTWRIGDGTAAFYNYVYYKVAGFTEHDVFRSNQILDGVMDRDKALRLIARENQPRWQSIQEYCDMIGVDRHQLVDVVERIPKLYGNR